MSRHAQLIGQSTYVSMLVTITVVALGLGDSCRGRDIAPLGISRGFMGVLRVLVAINLGSLSPNR